MVSGEKSYTPAGNMRAARMGTVCSWVVKAWTDLKPDIITKSFKKWCISNAMDGTEDDVLWDNDSDIEAGASLDDGTATDMDPYDDMVPADVWDEVFGDDDNDDP